MVLIGQTVLIKRKPDMPTRREVLKSTLACTIAGTYSGVFAETDCYPSKNSSPPSPVSQFAVHPSHFKTIPSSNERITSLGMGTWITFDVADNAGVRKQRSQVLQAFFDGGGQMLDSSPMYGYAEEVLGVCLQQTQRDCSTFAASKIWTPVSFDAKAQMKNTENLWGVEPIDLMYVHNLVNWENHLPRLAEWKQAGRIRYLGVSTSHGLRHEELEKIINSQYLDFVQLTYNFDKRETENRLIPLARDNGIAVVVNRPFARGGLISKYERTALPGIAKELGCKTWPQYLLLFAVSHPGVTVAIPATSNVDHMQENMAVLQLELPDSELRHQLF